jgi:hypothetical protein
MQHTTVTLYILTACMQHARTHGKFTERAEIYDYVKPLLELQNKNSQTYQNICDGLDFNFDSTLDMAYKISPSPIKEWPSSIQSCLNSTTETGQGKMQPRILDTRNNGSSIFVQSLLSSPTGPCSPGG